MNELRLLVVDDEVDTLKALEIGLQEGNRMLHTASSHNEAINILKSLEIDLVVSDLKLKDGTGLDIHHFIK